MSHPLSYRAYGCIVIALLCVVIAVQIGCGCATQKPVAEYGVDTFTIKVADRAVIQNEWDKYQNHKCVQVSGFCDEMTRTIWVEYGYGGKPSFETLGHEVWHLSELGGRWHE